MTNNPLLAVIHLLDGMEVYKYIEVLDGKVVQLIWSDILRTPSPDKGGKVFLLTALQFDVLSKYEFDTKAMIEDPQYMSKEIALVVELIERSSPADSGEHLF